VADQPVVLGVELSTSKSTLATDRLGKPEEFEISDEEVKNRP
jgi:hypothetical protein